MQKIIDDKVQEMLQNDIIELSRAHGAPRSWSFEKRTGGLAFAMTSGKSTRSRNTTPIPCYRSMPL